ncbi:S8 family serine peptidase [Rubripirellula obstinata]|nr:S8 family serine peptidase [Rubripirellula obstinata]
MRQKLKTKCWNRRFEVLESRRLLAAEVLPFAASETLVLQQEIDSKPLDVASSAVEKRQATDHYFVDGQSIELSRLDNRMALRWKDGINRELPKFIQPIRTVNDVWMVYEVPGFSAVGPNVQNWMSGHEGVTGEVPVFLNLATDSEAVVFDEVIVALDDDTDPEKFFLEQTQISDYRRLDGTTDQFVATVRADGSAPTKAVSDASLKLANGLSTDTRVRWATPNFFQSWKTYSTPNDPRLSNQWHVINTGQGGGVVDADVDLDEAWDINAGGSPNIVVGVVDDGVAIDHEDILNYRNPGEIPDDGLDNDGNGWVDDVFGWNFVANNNQSSYTSEDPHGTSVAGVAAGTGNNGVGIAGAAYQSTVLSARIFDSGNVASDANIAAAIYYMSGRTADGTGSWRSADVVNHSWGGGGPSPAIEDALRWGTTQGRQGIGVTHLFATGNEFGAVSQPAVLSATIPGVIAVGATNNFAERSNYSNFGAEVDVVTPSNDSRAGFLAIDTTDIPGTEGYASGDYTGTGSSGFGGTSSATPLATGITALALAELAEQDIALTPAQTREWIRTNTDLIGGVYDTATGHNVEFGYGRLNAGKLLRSIGKAEISVTSSTDDLVSGFSVVQSEDTFVGDSSRQGLRIRNQGTSPLDLNSFSLTEGAFSIVTGADGSTVSDTVLDIGEATTIEIQFSPDVNVNHTATLTIASTDADESAFEVLLSGLGVIASIEGFVFEDANGNGIRETSEAGAAGQRVYLDTDLNGEFTSSNQTFGSTAAVTIEDLLSVESSIEVSGVNEPTAIEVLVDIDHTFVGDLSLDLISPDGTSFRLASQVGESGNGFDGTVFADDADVPIESGSPPFQGRFRPQDVINQALLGTINGDWRLRVSDDFGEDDGTLNQWSIQFKSSEPSVQSNADGRYRFLNLDAASYPVGLAVSESWVATSALTQTVIVQQDQTSGNIDFGVAKRNRFYGAFYRDTNGNNIRDDDEIGVADQIAFNDANFNETLDMGTFVSFADSPDEPIVDLDVAVAVIEVAGIAANSVLDLDVQVDLTHTFTADLTLLLESPAGIQVPLFIQHGGSGENLTGTIFDDDASQSIAAASSPFTGRFQPIGSLSDFENGLINGAWTLRVFDVAPADVGTIDRWELMFTTGENIVTSDVNGNFYVDLPDGPAEIRSEIDSDLTISSPSDGLLAADAVGLPIFSNGFAIAPPAQVEDIIINQGDSQRSGIDQVRIVFDRVVDIDLETGDVFQFINDQEQRVAIDIPVLDHSSGTTIVDITFAPGETVNLGGGLLDGNYRLVIDAERVRSNGLAMDGDRDGVVGGDHIFGANDADRFFRKYGDFDADGQVGLSDFATFRSVFGLSVGQAGYVRSMDSGMDGQINLSDFADFRSGFGQ